MNEDRPSRMRPRSASGSAVRAWTFLRLRCEEAGRQARSKTSTSACSPPPILSAGSCSRSERRRPPPRRWPLTVDAAADHVDVGAARRVERELEPTRRRRTGRPGSTRRHAASPSRRGRRARRPGAACRACSRRRSASARSSAAMPRTFGRIQICRKWVVAVLGVVELAVPHAAAGAHALHVAGTDHAGGAPWPLPVPMLSLCASSPSST